MCKLVLRGPLPPVKGATAIEDLQYFQPGDLIDAMPDGHVFGDDEAAPLFQFVSVPDLAVADAQLLCAPPVNVYDLNGNLLKFAPRSSHNLDLTKATAEMTKADLIAAITQNALIDNPAVIGQPNNELG